MNKTPKCGPLVSSISPWQHVLAVCGRCGNLAAMDHTRWAKNASLTDIQARLKCKRCNAKAGAKLLVGPRYPR
jgi:hypothetical protein